MTVTSVIPVSVLIEAQMDECWRQDQALLDEAEFDALVTMQLLHDGTLEIPVNADGFAPQLSIEDLIPLQRDAHTRQSLSQRTSEAFISFSMRLVNRHKSHGHRPCPTKNRGDVSKKARIVRHHRTGALRTIMRVSVIDQLGELAARFVSPEAKLIATI